LGLGGSTPKNTSIVLLNGRFNPFTLYVKL
jgi:hypothetical protein